MTPSFTLNHYGGISHSEPSCPYIRQPRHIMPAPLTRHSPEPQHTHTIHHILLRPTISHTCFNAGAERELSLQVCLAIPAPPGLHSRNCKGSSHSVRDHRVVLIYDWSSFLRANRRSRGSHWYRKMLFNWGEHRSLQLFTGLTKVNSAAWRRCSP